MISEFDFTVCIKCGILRSWCLDKKHKRTKLANHCKVGNGDKHVWGTHRIPYDITDIIER